MAAVVAVAALLVLARLTGWGVLAIAAVTLIL
jgi:hypothetical protein